MTLVAQTCRTTGAPGSLPDDVLARWHGRPVRVAVGEHDVFFPIDRLRGPSLARLGVEPTVVPRAGHLVVDEEPAVVADLVASLF
jgi:pimeloyl-ACP methyl ester carboxylesterase